MTEAPLQLEIDTARQRLAALRTRARGESPDPLLAEALTALESAIAALESAHRNTTTGSAERRAVESNGHRPPHSLHDQWVHAAIEAMPVGVFCTDAAGQCIFVNARWCEMAGLAAADALGSGWAQALPAEDRAAAVNGWQESTRLARPFEMEIRIGAGRAPARWILVRVVPQCDSHGTVTDYIGTLTDIDDRRAMETALRTTQTRYEMLLDISPVGIFHMDPTGGCSYVSRRGCEITGLTAAEALGDGWVRAVHPADRERVVSGWMRAAQAQRAYEVEYRIQRPDGLVTWVLGQGVPALDREGVPLGWVGTLTDVTEQRRNESRFRLLFDANMIGIYFADAYGRITEANDSALDLFGYTRADLAEGAMSWVQMSPPEYAESDQMVSAQLQATGFCLPYEREFLRKDGSRVPVLIGAASFEEARDHGVAFMLDISKRRDAERAREEVLAELETRVAYRTNELATANTQLRHELAQREKVEAALRTSEALFVSVFEQAPVGMSLVRLSDSSSRFNRALRQLLEYSDSDVNPLDLAKLIHPEDMARVAQERDRVLSGETLGYQGERRYMRRSGEPVWVYANVSVVQDDDGTPRYILGHIQDISSRKQAEVALRESEERYRAVSELISDYAYGCHVNPDGRVMFDWCTEAFSRIAGFEMGEARPTLDMETFLHPDDRAVALVRRQRLLAGGSSISEFRIRTTGGDYRWLRDHARVEPEAHDPRVLRIVGAAQDITERRRAEEALRESEERYRTVSELTSDYAYCYRVEPDGHVVFEWHTEAFSRITGFEIGEAQGALEMEMILHPDDHEIAVARMQRFLAGESDISEFRIRTKSGDYRWLRDYGRPQWADHNGPVLRITGAAQDITEQRWAENALRQSEAKFRTLADTAAAAIFIYQDGRFQYANPEVTALLGYSPDELTEMTDPIQLIRPDHRELMRQRSLDRLRGEALPRRLEVAMLTKDDAERWVQFTGGLIQFNGAPAVLGTAFDITERKQVEAALRESEAKFRTLAETMAVATFIYQGTLLRYANPAAVALTGFSLAELHQMPSWGMIHPDFQPMIRERAAARDRGVPISAGLELKICTKDGRERWVDFIGGAIQYDGNPAVLGTAFDITERKQAEAALRGSEAKFRTLAETIPAAVFIYQGAAMRYANPAATGMTGFSREDLLGMQFWDIIHPDFRVLVRERGLARQRGEVVPSRYELKVCTKDGTERWVEFTGATIDLDGQPAVLGMAFDITARRRAEAALRGSEERFALAVAGANDGIWDWEFETNVLYASPRFHAILGLVDGEMPPRLHPWVQLIRGDDQGAIWAALDAHLSGAAAHFECPVRMRHRDGSFRWLLVRGLSVRNDHGAPYRMAGSVTDITERQRVDEETRQRQSELAHALRLNTLGEMVATLAHEINQPLAAILNYARGTARCLRSGGTQLAEVPAAVDRIAAEADRAAQIVRNLRDYVRKEKPRREWVELSPLARRAAALVEQEGRAVGATIDLRVLDGLPRVQVDPIQIEQVIVNLLLNGIEALRHLNEGPRLLIIETAWDGGDAVSLIVRDTGRDLPVAMAEQAFSAFFSTKPGGLGLGLTISRSIIEAHGGRLWLEPNPGGGAALHCTLPASSEAYAYGG